MDNEDLNWRKSQRSNGSGACVEVASTPRNVLVRDTTDRDGGTLSVSAEAWQRFTAGLR